MPLTAAWLQLTALQPAAAALLTAARLHRALRRLLRRLLRRPLLLLL
jgi:hypothetical protein